MKRSGPLPRYRGLDPGRGLQNSGDGLSRGAPLTRRRWVPAPPGDETRVAAAARRSAWALVRAEAWAIWGGRCAVGRDPLPFRACHGHHRLMKSAGGPDTLVNCLPVCGRCHDRIHRGGDVSYDAGWLVRAWLRPEDVPIIGAPRAGDVYPRM